MNGLMMSLSAGFFLLAIGSVVAAEPQVAHMVFFTLKEDSDANRQTLVSSCQKYLSDHDGVVYFSAGSRGADFDRPVNDQEFHVGLHVVFKDKAAHDVYQTHERHLKFIEENKATWAKVRVFDSYVPVTK